VNRKRVGNRNRGSNRSDPKWGRTRIRHAGRSKPKVGTGELATGDQPHEVVGCDLFAGAGGFSLGALNAEIRVAAAVEFDRHAAASYKNNLIQSGRTQTLLYEEDIEQLDPTIVRTAAGFEKSGCDILMGGPPCQGFSAHRINDAGVGDPRNALLLRYFEFVRVLRPMFFLVENVPGLLWPRHKSFLDTFYQLADAADYEVMDPVVLNAKDFGVPQSRRRVFILGMDRQRQATMPSWPPAATHIAEASQDDPRPTWMSASTAFERPVPPQDSNDIHMKHGKALLETFRATPPNGGSRKDSGRVLDCHRNHDGHKDVYGRIDPRRPAPTMTTACINPSKGRFVHPTLHHGITLRQAARLQTFPDWFVFDGGLMAGGVQVGNAVPIDMATALLMPLREAALAIKSSELLQSEATAA
jgi:DNA (cytosine-5)-methyltransferase 1